MANININELFELETQENPYSSSFIKTTRQDMFTHNVPFDKSIGEPHMYRELINLLYTADENAEFNFLVNSPGGNLSAAMAIIEAMKVSQANIRAIITGECHSAASMITLNCREIIVTDSAHMLVHTGSYGTGGNSHMVQSHVDFSTKMINKILASTYSGFLTESELHDVERGIEYWFDSDDIKERIEARKAFLQEKADATIKKPKKPVKRQSKAV